MIIESLINDYRELKRFLRNLGLVVRWAFSLCALAANVACTQEPTLVALSAPPTLECRAFELETFETEYPGRAAYDYEVFRRERLVSLEGREVGTAGGCLINLCAKGDRGACVDVAYLDMKYGATAELRSMGLKNLEHACQTTSLPACDVVGLELRDQEEYARALPYLAKECATNNPLTITYMCEYAGEAAEKIKDFKSAETNYLHACERGNRYNDCSPLADFYVRRQEFTKAKPVLRKECFGTGYTNLCTELARIYKREQNRAEYRAVAVQLCGNREFADPGEMAEMGVELQRLGLKAEAVLCLEKSCGPESLKGCQELEALYRADNKKDLAELARKRALEARKQAQCFPDSSV